MKPAHSPPNKSNFNAIGRTRSGSTALEDFALQMENLNKKFIEFDNRFGVLEKKLDNNHSNLSSHIEATIIELEIRLKAKFDLLETMEKNIKIKSAELNKLETKLENIKDCKSCIDTLPRDLIMRIDDIERSANNSSLIVRGVPHTPNENLMDYFKKISQSIEFKDNTPVIIYRITSFMGREDNAKERFSPIIIKFSTSNLRKIFFHKYLRYKKLSVQDIGFTAASRIYINECLTKYNYEIFKVAYKLKKSGTLSSVFTINGTVNVKALNDDKPMAIKFKEDLNTTTKPQHRTNNNGKQQ